MKDTNVADYFEVIDDTDRQILSPYVTFPLHSFFKARFESGKTQDFFEVLEGADDSPIMMNPNDFFGLLEDVPPANSDPFPDALLRQNIYDDGTPVVVHDLSPAYQAPPVVLSPAYHAPTSSQISPAALEAAESYLSSPSIIADDTYSNFSLGVAEPASDTFPQPSGGNKGY